MAEAAAAAPMLPLAAACQGGLTIVRDLLATPNAAAVIIYTTVEFQNVNRIWKTQNIAWLLPFKAVPWDFSLNRYSESL